MEVKILELKAELDVDVDELKKEIDKLVKRDEYDSIFQFESNVDITTIKPKEFKDIELSNPTVCYVGSGASGFIGILDLLENVGKTLDLEPNKKEVVENDINKEKFKFESTANVKSDYDVFEEECFKIGIAIENMNMPQVLNSISLKMFGEINSNNRSESDIKKSIKRAKNPMEKQMYQRELSELNKFKGKHRRR